MRVLQITPYDVFPPIDGAPHRSHGLVSAFPAAGDEVVRYCQRGPASRLYKLYMNGKQFGENRLSRTVTIADGYTELRSQNLLYDFASVPALFGYPQVLLGTSLDVHIPRRLKQSLSWADIVMIEKPWQFSAIERCCDDVPVVYSSHDMVAELYADVQTELFGDWIYERLESLERVAVETADLVVCTSERDKSQFEDAYAPTGSLTVAPNAIEQSAIRDVPESGESTTALRKDLGIPERALVCLFIGGRHGPNIDAVDRIVDMAADSDLADLDVHFLLVGSAGDSLERTRPNVTVTGYVSELEPYFDIADIGLNPIEWGGGTNIKMLDYFARGLPVVSTPFGSRGFDLTSGEEVVIKRMPEFSEGVELLAGDSKLRAQIGQRAHDFVRDNYVWDEVSQHLRGELQSVVNNWG